ncbi:MAG: ABC transporter ATP-binding protein [Chloroflexi bacterium]|nr:ABC transporter ATP-binding protein [Chloroflexota bacterium]
MENVLEFNQLYYRFPGADKPALNGATLTLTRGKKIVLVGRNGSGKSTLLLHANGILKPESGEVRVLGRPLQYSRKELVSARQQVGLIFQNPDDQLFSASVEQDISFGAVNLGLTDEEVRDRVASVAAMCEITDLLDRPTHALSGGQKMRVAIAGVLTMNPQVILADEVTAGLDPWMRIHVLESFDRLVKQGVVVLFATHDLNIARFWADEVAVMENGQVTTVGLPTQVFDNPMWREVLY